MSPIDDPASGRVVLFGGWGEGLDDSNLGDAWAYDPAASTWTNLNPAGDVPHERYWHSVGT